MRQAQSETSRREAHLRRYAADACGQDRQIVTLVPMIHRGEARMCRESCRSCRRRIVKHVPLHRNSLTMLYITCKSKLVLTRLYIHGFLARTLLLLSSLTEGYDKGYQGGKIHLEDGYSSRNTKKSSKSTCAEMRVATVLQK